MRAGSRDHADLALAYLAHTDPVHGWGTHPQPDTGLVQAVVGLIVEQRRTNELLARIADSLGELAATPVGRKRRWFW